MSEENKVNQELNKGYLYLVKEKKPIKSYEYFMKLKKEKVEGLCISRQHPERLRKRYLMNGTTILWLTTAIGENYINPVNIGILSNFTATFIEKNPNNSVVLIEGIEYLTIYNDFENVLKSIYYINEVAQTNGAIVLIPLSPQAFLEKNLALLERDAEIIEAN